MGLDGGWDRSKDKRWDGLGTGNGTGQGWEARLRGEGIRKWNGTGCGLLD